MNFLNKRKSKSQKLSLLANFFPIKKPPLNTNSDQFHAPKVPSRNQKTMMNFESLKRKTED